MDRDALIREAVEESLKREAEARRFLYADVEDLIRKGHLLHPARINGVTLVLRSLTDEDMDALLARIEFSTAAEWKRWYIATSLYMANGYVIPEDPNAPYYAYNEWFRDLSTEWVDVLFSFVWGLRSRVDRATRIVSAYAYEDYSRNLWAIAPDGHRSGNIVRRLWSLYNKGEDEFQASLRQWAHTRAVVGAMSGKGAKSISQAEKKWVAQRKEHAQKIIEETVNWIIYGDPEEQPPVVVTIGGKEYVVPKIHAALSVEELYGELMQSVRGERDYHDEMIARYKDFHRQRMEQMEREQREALEAAAKARGDDLAEGIGGETRMVGYTMDQLSHVNPKLVERGPNVQRETFDPDAERFRQYLDTDVGVAWIGADGNPTPVDQKPTKPEPGSNPDPGGEGASLQDRVANRRPRLATPGPGPGSDPDS